MPRSNPTKTVLLDLVEGVNKTLETDVVEITNFIFTYKSSLLDVLEKLNKLLQLTEKNQFPNDNGIRSQIFGILDLDFPTLSTELKSLRENASRKLNDFQGEVSKCYVKTFSKVPSSDLDSNHKSSPVVSSLTSPHPTSSITKSLDKCEDVNTQYELLSRTTKSPDQPIKQDIWVNDGPDNKTEVTNDVVDEDEILPEDSASNVGAPVSVRKPVINNYPEPVIASHSISPVSDPEPDLGFVIPRQEFSKLHQVNNVSCEWINEQFHPYRFWLRVTNPKYDEMMNGIERKMSQLKPVPVHAIKKKLYCLAKYGDMWYRAYLTDVRGDNAVVIFIDYGNIESLSFDQLAVLPKEFSKLTWQAFWVALEGIMPNNCSNPNCCEVWPREVLSYIAAVFSDTSITCDCRIQDHVPRLPYLVKVRFRKNKKSPVILQDYLKKKYLLQSTTRENQIELMKIPSTVFVKTPEKSPVVTTELEPQPEAISPDPIKPCSVDLLTAFNSVTSSNNSAVDLCPKLPENSLFTVKITSFNSPDDFFIQLADQNYLPLDQIKAAKGCAKKQLSAACVGRYVLYYSPERESYYRGKIVAMGDNGSRVDIMDIDSGLVEEGIPFPGKIAPLPANLQDDYQKSFRCCLSRDPSKKYLILDFPIFYKSKIVGNILSASVAAQANVEKVEDYRSGSVPLPVNMFLEEKNLCDLIFIQSGEAKATKGDEQVPDWKFEGGLSDDDDDDLVIPSDPDAFLLGFTPKDDAELCKHFRRHGKCPRGQYCSFKHERLNPSQITTEKEEFGVVEVMEVAVPSMVYVELPKNWKEEFAEALERNLSSRVVELWFLLPQGCENIKGKERAFLKNLSSQEYSKFEEQWIDLELEMSEKYDSRAGNSNKNLIPAEGMHVAVEVPLRVLHDGDHGDKLVWVRGLVIEVLRDDRHTRVRLFDHGIEIVVSSEHIQALDLDFAQKLPALALGMYIDRKSAESFLEKMSNENEEFDGIFVDIIKQDEQDFIPEGKLRLKKKGFDGD